MRRWLYGISLLGGMALWPTAAQALTCQQSPAAVVQKQTLLQAALTGNPEAQQQYQTLLSQQGGLLNQCRQQTWNPSQSIWLRLYPCDSRPGAIEALLDDIVNRGYNQINLEVFYDGQVLLPSANNPTVWGSILQERGTEQVDLLAEVIAKGRQRGLKVYAWLFALNFGYTYSLKPDRQIALARNGYGETSLTRGTQVHQVADLSGTDETFVDPYSPIARNDYAQLVQAVLQRRPDGILFDYIRYPKGVGPASIASQVKDLWIYGDAAQSAFLQRAQNDSGRELIRRFLRHGSVSAEEVQAVATLYPHEASPQWQGRGSSGSISQDLWNLALEHARQGILEFLAAASLPAQQQGIPIGVVFFPEGNQTIKSGVDSRLQPWDRFPAQAEWYPMAYGLCPDGSCVVNQVKQVLEKAATTTPVIPTIAGTWQTELASHPPLEMQLAALQSLAPRIQATSHFSYSWQQPDADRSRKFCRLR